MVGWHHPFNGHEFEQALGAGDGEGSLVCCGPLGHRESDTTERYGELHPFYGESVEAQKGKEVTEGPNLERGGAQCGTRELCL